MFILFFYCTIILCGIFKDKNNQKIFFRNDGAQYKKGQLTEDQEEIISKVREMKEFPSLGDYPNKTDLYLIFNFLPTQLISLDIEISDTNLILNGDSFTYDYIYLSNVFSKLTAKVIDGKLLEWFLLEYLNYLNLKNAVEIPFKVPKEQIDRPYEWLFETLIDSDDTYTSLKKFIDYYKANVEKYFNNPEEENGLSKKIKNDKEIIVNKINSNFELYLYVLLKLFEDLSLISEDYKSKCNLVVIHCDDYFRKRLKGSKCKGKCKIKISNDMTRYKLFAIGPKKKKAPAPESPSNKNNGENEIYDNRPTDEREVDENELQVDYEVNEKEFTEKNEIYPEYSTGESKIDEKESESEIKNNSNHENLGIQNSLNNFGPDNNNRHNDVPQKLRGDNMMKDRNGTGDFKDFFKQPNNYSETNVEDLDYEQEYKTNEVQKPAKKDKNEKSKEVFKSSSKETLYNKNWENHSKTGSMDRSEIPSGQRSKNLVNLPSTSIKNKNNGYFEKNSYKSVKENALESENKTQYIDDSLETVSDFDGNNIGMDEADDLIGLRNDGNEQEEGVEDEIPQLGTNRKISDKEISDSSEVSLDEEQDSTSEEQPEYVEKEQTPFNGEKSLDVEKPKEISRKSSHHSNEKLKETENVAIETKEETKIEPGSSKKEGDNVSLKSQESDKKSVKSFSKDSVQKNKDDDENPIILPTIDEKVIETQKVDSENMNLQSDQKDLLVQESGENDGSTGISEKKENPEQLITDKFLNAEKEQIGAA